MDLKKIEKLMELMKEHQLSEVEVQHGEDRILLKAPSSVQTTMIPQFHQIPIPPQAQAPARTSTMSEEKAAAILENTNTNIKIITSPFVGTFYGAPSPEADPFVQVGKRINKGDVLCIVEAMKLMNEIESDVLGVVKKILVKNSTPVEFEQALFEIELE